MASKVSWKVFQYKVADSLDKVRLPNNLRALVRRENNAGEDAVNDNPNPHLLLLFSLYSIQPSAISQLFGLECDNASGISSQVTLRSRINMSNLRLKTFHLSDVIKNGNTELVLLEGSKAGSKLYSFTTGGDLLMGRNIIRRFVVRLTNSISHDGNGCRHEKYGTIAERERLYLVNIYRAQHYLHHLHSLLPVVSLMNGAVMGSGTMFGLNSTWSVATERTVWALPEVSIGGMPDVGALYHMYRRQGQLGTMLALTGYR